MKPTAHRQTRPAWYSVRQIARRFGVVGETVRQWIIRGIQTPAGYVRLRGIQIGNRWSVRRQWLRDFVEAMEAAQGSREQANPVPKVEPTTKQQERFRREREELMKRLGRK